jgi:hypothetical protein
MSLNRKQQLLGFLIFAFLLMVIIGVSLPLVQMERGQIFSLQGPNQTTSGASQTLYDMSWLFIVIQGFQIFLLILAFVYIVISLFDKNARRKLLKDLLKIALLFILMQFFLKNWEPSLPSLEEEMLPSGLMDPAELSGEIVPPSIFEANPQPWMFPLIAVVAATLLALLTFGILFMLLKRRRANRPQYSDIADNAQKALDEIEQAKFEFSDVIIRCYAEMSQTLAIEKDIQRSQAMTTHEFEQDLLLRGFPTRPVQQLTKLFEQVRYGRQQTGDNEKQIATESLREIIAFCRGQA